MEVVREAAAEALLRGCGRFPFQQVTPRDQQRDRACARPHPPRAGPDPPKRRWPAMTGARVEGSPLASRAWRRQERLPWMRARSPVDSEQHERPGGNQQRDQRPEPGRARQHRPAQQEQQQQTGRNQAAAQVVEDLPALQERQWIAASGGGGCRLGRSLALPRCRSTKQPRQDLPVAAGPAVFTAGKYVVAGREIVEQLNVGDQAAAGKVALDQVVAEDRVLGEALDRPPLRTHPRRRCPCRCSCRRRTGPDRRRKQRWCRDRSRPKWRKCGQRESVRPLAW